MSDFLFDDDIDELPEGELTVADIREPGLYPRFTFFHSVTRTEWQKIIPYKTNLLVSAYSMLHGIGSGGDQDYLLQEALQYAKFSRKVFVDSGLFTPLIAASKGKVKPEHVHEWLGQQHRVVEVAWKLYDAGCTDGVVAAMDVPSTAAVLEKVGLDFEKALKATVKNAIDMRGYEIPPGWNRVYMAQGREPQEFLRSMNLYEDAGLLDEVREGKSWLGIGGINRTKSPALENTVRLVRDKLGEGHIHALGVAGDRVAPLAARNLVQSADATSAHLPVTMNAGPYRVTGPRPSFLLYALWSAAFLRYDTMLARRIKELEERGFADQEMMFA